MGLAAILLGSFAMEVTEPIAAFGGMYVLDGFALFFKRFFLIATALVLLMSSEYAKTFRNGTGEYMSLSLFALSGMMFAASANHLPCSLFPGTDHHHLLHPDQFPAASNHLSGGGDQIPDPGRPLFGLSDLWHRTGVWGLGHHAL